MRDKKLYFYDDIADRFDTICNSYDLQRRLHLVFDELLGEVKLSNLDLLDVGCGTGWFSQRAKRQGANVTSLDIGTRLLAKARKKCDSHPVAGDACLLPFPDETFDIVISSECIEHTLDPHRAVSEMKRVTKVGGLFVVTTPNRVWRPVASVAEFFKLRPYEGYEDWLGWGEMRRLLRHQRVVMIEMRGFHLVPPRFAWMWPILRKFDVLGSVLGPIMLNMAVSARKLGH